MQQKKDNLYNPYLESVHQNMPRLLALFDSDNSSNTYGLGDRYRWAWGLTDFANGTYQGAAHGFARLFVNDYLPPMLSKESIKIRIDSLFEGTRKIKRKNGSLEEAFPYEGSFCVTALVAYDLLSTIELMKDYLDQRDYDYKLSIVEPLILYLLKSDETHAFISNHLATAAAALLKWHQLTSNNSMNRGQLFLQRILDNQSGEGWYREYEGADPGYQSLCTYYLADIHRMFPQMGLLESLDSSVKFLWNFAHPDGSFGGIYGSRNTRFYYPAGIEYLASEIPESAALAQYMRDSIAKQSVVTLSVMDESNLVPMFNAYCWAAAINSDVADSPVVPCKQKNKNRIYWPEAGLLIDSDSDHYTVISTHKGGVIYHFVDDRISLLNTGVVIKKRNQKLLSTQAYQSNNSIQIDNSVVTIDAKFQFMTRQLPSPLQMIVLRLLNVTLMRMTWCRELIKSLLVKMLITKKKGLAVKNTRTITLGKNLNFSDNVQPSNDYSIEEKFTNFIAIHMASKGYWQLSDDDGSGR